MEVGLLCQFVVQVHELVEEPAPDVQQCLDGPLAARQGEVHSNRSQGLSGDLAILERQNSAEGGKAFRE